MYDHPYIFIVRSVTLLHNKYVNLMGYFLQKKSKCFLITQKLILDKNTPNILKRDD
jgi:hypothetical protein